MAQLTLSAKQTADFELLANGGFAPLTTFQEHEDYVSVVENMRLASGEPWSIPVVLGSETGELGETLELVGGQGEQLGTIAIPLSRGISLAAPPTSPGRARRSRSAGGRAPGPRRRRGRR